MADRDGHVHHFEYTRKHGADLDSAIAGALDITSVWAGVQLHMRHTHTRRALYKMVDMGDAVRLQRRSPHRHIRRYTVANSQSG